MALPGTLDPTTPAGTDSPSLGDDQFRALKQYLIDVTGYPNASAVTAAASTITTGGLVTFSQSPLTVPTLLQGTASQVLRIGSQYSNIGFEINAATIMAITATGLLQQTRYHEWASGITGVLGTQGAQPLLLRSNTLDRWQVNPSGILAPVVSVLDLGTSGGPNPRNLYVASNLVLGGSIQIGGALPLTIASDAQGDILYRGAVASGWLNLAAGSSGQFLRTQGTSGDPVWITGSVGPGAVTVSDNPVAWTGGHSWSSPTFLLTSSTVRAGVGTSVPTYMLDVRGNVIGTSNLYLGGQFVAGATGMLGVGTLTPTAMLHVAGSAYVASNIYLAGSNLPLPVGLGTSRLTFVSATSIQLGQGVIPLLVNGSWTQRAITSAITVSNTGLAANTTYFIYAADSAGSTILDAPSITGHSTNATFGVETKTGDATRTLVGMIRTGAGVPGVFVDSATQRFTIGYFNRQAIGGVNAFAANRATASLTYVELSSTERVEFVTWSTEAVLLAVTGFINDNTTTRAHHLTSIGIDGATAEEIMSKTLTGTIGDPSGSIACSLVKNGLAEGYHFATILGSVNAGTGTWGGSATAGTRSSITFGIRG